MGLCTSKSKATLSKDGGGATLIPPHLTCEGHSVRVSNCYIWLLRQRNCFLCNIKFPFQFDGSRADVKRLEGKSMFFMS